MPGAYGVQRTVSLAKLRRFCPQLRGCALRPSSDLSYLRQEMIARKFPFVTDYMTPVTTRLLKRTLLDFIHYPRLRSNPVNKLPIGHHLVYFPSQTRLSSLFPDGTDPLHSPGPPFTRRMWAGGNIEFLKPLKLDLAAFHVLEEIVDVEFKGEADNQKAFVTIKRTIHRGQKPHELTIDNNAHILETRNIVFLREKAQSTSEEPEQRSTKLLIPTRSPDYSVRLTLTPAMLFRFSALTFNAHAIHLDKKYCQEVEGYRNLLVHGPLTLVLMLEGLKAYLAKKNDNKPTIRGVERIRAVEYRNLAPLYAEEEMKICVRRKTQETDRGSFDVWIEGKEGGYAVKGLVATSIEVPLGKDVGKPSIFDKGDSTDKEVARSGDTDLEKERSSVSETATGDETILKSREQSVEEISTGDEKVPGEENASRHDDDENPAPYFQR